MTTPDEAADPEATLGAPIEDDDEKDTWGSPVSDHPLGFLL